MQPWVRFRWQTTWKTSLVWGTYTLSDKAGKAYQALLEKCTHHWHRFAPSEKYTNTNGQRTTLLLTELGRPGQENIWPSVRTDCPWANEIFPHLAWPVTQSINEAYTKLTGCNTELFIILITGVHNKTGFACIWLKKRAKRNRLGDNIWHIFTYHVCSG